MLAIIAVPGAGESGNLSFQEQLFVSKKSVFDGRKPIRGGIPFIFPQFGTWHYGTNGPPYNGFGRVARWQCDKVSRGRGTTSRLLGKADKGVGLAAEK